MSLADEIEEAPYWFQLSRPGLLRVRGKITAAGSTAARSKR